jgi:hypothetical protein
MPCAGKAKTRMISEHWEDGADVALWSCPEVTMRFPKKLQILALFTTVIVATACGVGPRGAPEPEARLHTLENTVGQSPFWVKLSWETVCTTWVGHPTSSACREQSFRASFDCGEVGCEVETRRNGMVEALDEDAVFEEATTFWVTPSGFGDLNMVVTMTNEDKDESFDAVFNTVRVWDPEVLTMSIGCEVQIEGGPESAERPCQSIEERTEEGQTIRHLFFSTRMTANDGTTFVARTLEHTIEGANEVSGSSHLSQKDDGRLSLRLMEPGTLTFSSTREGFGTHSMTVEIQ